MSLTDLNLLVGVRLPLGLETNAGRVQLRTRQISMQGLSLVTRTKHEIGQQLRLIIEFPGWQFRQDGQVRLIQDRFVGAMLAVSFVDLDEDDEERLRQELGGLAQATAGSGDQKVL